VDSSLGLRFGSYLQGRGIRWTGFRILDQTHLEVLPKVLRSIAVEITEQRTNKDAAQSQGD